MKQLSTTPLNSVNQSKTWQRPGIETKHVKKKKSREYSTGIYTTNNMETLTLKTHTPIQENETKHAELKHPRETLQS